MSNDRGAEVRCANCERPIVRVSGDWHGRQWVHRSIEPETVDFYYCTIAPNVALSANPHAEPSGAIGPDSPNKE